MIGAPWKRLSIHPGADCKSSMDDAYEVQTSHSMFCRSYVNFYIANGGIVMRRFRRRSGRAVVQAAFRTVGSPNAVHLFGAP
jgi:agmatine/peptidylarginine deiminase